MTEITSLQNERVKEIVKLRDDKRLRQCEGVALVEGAYEIELALAGGFHPLEIFHCHDLSSGTEIKGLSCDPVMVTRAVFEKMSYREGPDGWLATIPVNKRTLEELELPKIPLLVLAESVEKPGNLGAILRTADAAGVSGVIVSDPRVDLYNPNVVRASRGTIFTLPIVECSNEAAFDHLRKNRIKILAATPDAELAYTDVNLCQAICLAVGTEDEGLSKFWLENADLRVKIPMMGKVNSLNVSTSTAIIIYEVLRQRAQRENA